MNRTLTVLVVDDDFRVAGVHADVVAETGGFECVGAARTIAEARGLLAERRPDLLLADVYLPDGDGIELVRGSGTDAFVLSAVDSPQLVHRAIQAGALSYLVKPFSRRSLADRLERYARYRNLLEGPQGLEQEQIDRALSILHGAQPPASTTRLVTERVVLEALGSGDSSAADVAERAGVSRATAQRRLASLASRGLVDVRLRYGTSGRPEHRYVLPES